MKIYVIKLIVLISCLLFLGSRKEELRAYKQYGELLGHISEGKNPPMENIAVKLEDAFLSVSTSLLEEKKRREAKEQNLKAMEKEAEKLEQMLFNINRQLARIPQTNSEDAAYHQILQVQLTEQLKEIDKLVAKRKVMNKELVVLKEFITPYKLKIEKIGKILYKKINGINTNGRIPANWDGSEELGSTLHEFSTEIIDKLEKEQLSVFHLYTLYKMVSFSLELLQIKTQNTKEQILKRFSSLAPSYLIQENNSIHSCPLTPDYFYP